MSKQSEMLAKKIALNEETGGEEVVRDEDGVYRRASASTSLATRPPAVLSPVAYGVAGALVGYIGASFLGINGLVGALGVGAGAYFYGRSGS